MLSHSSFLKSQPASFLKKANNSFALNKRNEKNFAQLFYSIAHFIQQYKQSLFKLLFTIKYRYNVNRKLCQRKWNKNVL